MENENTQKRKPGRPFGSTSHKTENIIEFTNGSVIHFRSATNPDTIRGLSRELFNTYYEQDIDFRREVDEIREDAIDYVEGQLFK